VPNFAAFISGAGLMAPGHSFAMLTRRHMELYGTKREHLAEVAISQRENAIRRPTALQRNPLTLDEYFSARMISDPLCLYDYTMETDGAVAAVVTSAERATDLRHLPSTSPRMIVSSSRPSTYRYPSASSRPRSRVSKKPRASTAAPSPAYSPAT
jgi:acetyl-CoA acetyltransferase